MPHPKISSHFCLCRLAVLKLHEKELCEVQDDSELLVVVKQFFQSLNLTSDTSDEEYAKKLAVFTSLMKSAVSSVFLCSRLSFYTNVLSLIVWRL